MSAANLFPFAALVGLDPLKLALQLAAIDARLSVLLRGDKGAGKSTAARGLAELLAPGAPFVTLPIGATEDRLLGGLDVERALAGEPALKPGLMAQAHGGVLYVDEVNLLADHLADALLDAVASGVLVVEREGFSVSQPAELVLLGSMNPEEGTLRPQLLDRFALVVDVQAPMDASARSEVLERRLAYDTDRAAFRERWAAEQAVLAEQLAHARVADVQTPRELLHYVAARVAAYGVRSLRADLALVRASRAYAAMLGAETVTEAHVETVLPLALAHRLPAGSNVSQGRTPSESHRPSNTEEPPAGDAPADERIFDAQPHAAPRLVVDRSPVRQGGSTGRHVPPAGHVVAARPSADPAEVDLRASLVHAVARSGLPGIAATDLHERVRAARSGTRFILVVDSSGSHAIRDRMRLVKGVVSGLLESSQGRRDEVVVIGCRGPAASVLVEPTSSREQAERALEYLPTGGRTPLAHGLELAAQYVTDHAVLVLVTDGHANVPTRTDDGWMDARDAAECIRCSALVIDTEDAGAATGRPRELAEAMRAQYVRLDDLDASVVLTIVRGPA